MEAESLPLAMPISAQHAASLLAAASIDVERAASSSSRPPRDYFPRATQLDSNLLDGELLNILRLQCGQVLDRVAPSLLQRLAPEVEAALRLAIFAFTVAVERPTPGQRLLGLCFRDARTRARTAPTLPQKCGFAAAIVAEWGFARLRRHMLTSGWGDRAAAAAAAAVAVEEVNGGGGAAAVGDAAAGDADRAAVAAWQIRVWVAVRRARLLWSVASFLNFIALLSGRGGGYGTLVQRLLRVRIVRDLRKDAVEPSFQMLNQQLVWSSVGSLMIQIAPLVPWSAARGAARGAGRAVRAGWRWARRTVGYGAAADAAATEEGGGDGDGASAPALALGGGCVVCGSAAPCMPYRAGCGHCFCYVCIQQQLRAGGAGAACPTCRSPLTTSCRLEVKKVARSSA